MWAADVLVCPLSVDLGVGFVVTRVARDSVNPTYKVLEYFDLLTLRQSITRSATTT